MSKRFEFAVIGAGLIGSAAAKYIATNNNNVILIGPKEPETKINHNGIFGSHYDEGRITRIADIDTTWAYLAKKSIKKYDSITACFKRAEHFVAISYNALSTFKSSKEKSVLQNLTSFSLERSF